MVDAAAEYPRRAADAVRYDVVTGITNGLFKSWSVSLHHHSLRLSKNRRHRDSLEADRIAKFVGDCDARGLQRGGDYFRLAATFGKCVVTSRSSAAMASSTARRARPVLPKYRGELRDQVYFSGF
ncbi:unnamed protein product [Leptosia nina]|uniref:Uncharacterized protein n=1 Tax=Leptosia nina TaxID=320188 RepID=A0AAV1JG13_9NEOP